MADFRLYTVTLTGTMPLLLHGDNLDWRASLAAWRAHPDNKAKSVAGDDRSPAWSWIGGLYHDGHVLGVSADNLMTAIREGGARVSVPGKRSLTYKRQSQSGLVINELLWPLVGPKGTVAWDEVNAHCDEEDFTVHQEFARLHGFELFVKSARIGNKKHIRVRAKFLTWRLRGTITVFDDTITTSVLGSILTAAGRYAGICDWRPSSPNAPGPYGTFTAALTEGE
jgi:hypothetical protein